MHSNTPIGNLPLRRLLFVQGEKKLSSLTKLECETCSRDVDRFYDVSADLVEMNERLLSLAITQIQGSKAFGSGRVVILRDGVCASSFFRHRFN